MIEDLELYNLMIRYSITQFRTNPAYLKCCEAHIVGLQTILDTVNYLSDCLNVDKAEGIWLDNIGTLVGIARKSFDISKYFCLNAEDLNKEKLFYFETSQDDYNSVPDEIYRKQIKAKIAYNNSRCTRNENLKIIKAITNADEVKIRSPKPMVLDVTLYGKDIIFSDASGLRNTIESIFANGVGLGELALPDLIEIGPTNWIQSEMPVEAYWKSITYGNERFVAVTYNSNVSAYSDDGINWTQTELPVSTNWYSVTYGNGRFVAIAYGTTISAYSDDGINWIQTEMPISTKWNSSYESANWRSVTYGNGKFVAVAGSNSIYSAYSTDGINWTQAEMPVSTYWWAVTYGNGKFVAVDGYNSTISAYSTDGITWTQTELPVKDNWRSVTYGNGKFVAFPNTPRSISLYSDDGINWTQTELPTWDYWTSVTYGNHRFVAIAHSARMIYSVDGITWKQAEFPTVNNWNSITYGNGKFVAVAGTDSLPSTDTFLNSISAYCDFSIML